MNDNDFCSSLFSELKLTVFQQNIDILGLVSFSLLPSLPSCQEKLALQILDRHDYLQYWIDAVSDLPTL